MLSKDYKIGIYKITSNVDGKIYIGSSINITNRWKAHIKKLKENTHHSRYFQNAWNKHGSDNFIFERIENVKDKNKLLEREQYYLDKLTPFANLDRGYNINPMAGSNLGVKYSEESKKKMSSWIRTPEMVAKISKANKGQKRSLETRKLISNIRKKQSQGPNYINGNSNKIYQYNFDTGELIRIWPSSNLIKKEYGWSKQTICRNCQLIKKDNLIIAFKDFIWSYVKIDNIEEYKTNNNIIKKYKYLGTQGNHFRG